MIERYFSQFGEDKWIRENIPLPDTGVFVEIGADDGVENSNTLHFEMNGWTGLCIEPVPDAFMAMMANRNCLHSYCAIGTNEHAVFFINPKKGWSGFNRGGRVFNVRTAPLGTVLETHYINRIDLLSIDTEGTEIDVLNSFDIEVHKPGIIIVEYLTEPMPSNEPNICDWFSGKPYDVVHRTECNLILQRKE